MCGLAGYVNFEDVAGLLRLAEQSQGHRGPDNRGAWVHDRVALAHQRLSIIDLSERANQPFQKDEYVIVFNGEIYNYKVLKSELESKHGVRFITDSDTEVVLEAFRCWSFSCLNRLAGMFAFALYTSRTGKLILARDHFGIKPLYYTLYRNQFAFSSELKTLLRVPGLPKSVNAQSLLGALNYLWIPGEGTMIRGIEKLPPAHTLELQTRDPQLAPQIRRYWELPVDVRDRPEADLREEADQVIQDSVKRHMVADVPVSSFLSGGLDSSLISVLASRHNSRLSTYTIGTRAKDKRVEGMPDDEKYADLLARQHGFDHHKIIVDPSVVDDLPRLVEKFDEPIGDPAAINTYLICKQAREEGVKVLLSGMGADELFLGYRRQQATRIAAHYQQLPGLLRSPLEWGARRLPVKIGGRGFKLGRWAKRFVAFGSLPIEQAYRRSYSYYDDASYPDLLTGDYAGELDALKQQHHDLFYAHPDLDLENKMCFTDVHMFMNGLNLTYSDRASMAASVEVRVPFIDREVAEFAMTVPGKYKFRKGESKYILKRAAEPHLPREIIYRPKASFGSPIRAWISNDLRDMVDDLLSEERIKRRGLFRYDFVRKMIDEDRKGVNDFAYQIYQLLTLELWFDEFL